MTTLVDPCRQHQIKICLDAASRDMEKQMKEIWNANAQGTNVDFRMNLSIKKKHIREIDKKFSLLANYPKGKGEVFKV